MYNSLQGGLLIYYLFYSWIGLIELLLLRLGITFSSNGKWSDHIDNIYKSALKESNVVKKLSRSALNKIYNTFILPLLEYACEVWDGCSKGDEE